MLKPVLVEIIVAASEEEAVMEIAIELEKTGLTLDHNFLPIRLDQRRYEGMRPDDCVYMVRGEIEEGRIAELRAADGVGYAWIDEPVESPYVVWRDEDGIWRYGLPPSTP